MKHARLLAFLLIPLVSGCDIAVVAVLMSRKSGSKDSAPPAPDTSFGIWVANLAAGTLTDAQVQTAIHNNGGQPTAEWTKVGAFTKTTEVDLALVPGAWDSILISATSNQKYLLDAVVILNASGDPLSSFSATLNELMLTPAEANNLADGKTSETDAIPGQNAFMFKRFTGPVVPLTRFRVETWEKTLGPTSGDTAWRLTIASGGEQRSGGLGVFGAPGAEVCFVSLRDIAGTKDTIEVLQVGATGIPGANVPIESNVTAQVGAPSLAVATNGDLIVAHSAGAGDLRVRRFNSSLSTTVWNQPIPNSGTTPARVEANSLSLDASDNSIIAGGFDFGVANGGFGHFMQRLRASDGALWATAPLPPVDVSNSYWRAVMTLGTDDIFATGDLLGILPSTSLDVFTRKTSQSSLGVETWRSLVNGANNLADCGNAIGVGSGGFIYVGGFFTTSGPTRKNAIIFKLDPTGASLGTPWNFTLLGSGTGDNEVLSMVVEGNVIYATGYESTAAQGRNLFVVKIDGSNASPLILWKRSFHNGVGDDRGVSIRTTATHVFVSGDVDLGGGDFDIFVWKLLK